MPLKLGRALKREVEIHGVPYTVTVSPLGVRLVRKGFRKGVAVSWRRLLQMAGGADGEATAGPTRTLPSIVTHRTRRPPRRPPGTPDGAAGIAYVPRPPHAERAMQRPSRRLAVRAATVAALVASPLVAGGWMLQSRVPARGGSAQLLDQVMGLVAQRFVDTVGSGALYERAARGLVKELNDPYSELFTPKQIADFSRTTNGRYAGIGMEIQPPPTAQSGFVSVSRVFPNTPAEGAGVQEGDRIVQIDTQATRGWSTQQVSNTLIGTPGTRVTVTFQRPGVATPIKANLTRAVIHIPAVPYSLVFDNTVGYVVAQRFSESTAEEIAQAVKALEAKGAKGVILDLRGNPGGILEQAVATSNVFLKRGQDVLSQRGRQGESQVYVATEQPVAPNVPLVVMIDGGSASASEIVAGALQDHDRAVVVGTTSFGKGLVQTLFPLDGGYALKLTTAKYYLPSGRSIHKERKLQADGQFVEVHPDSVETDSARKARPVFRSDAGRVVYGGGAVTPDVVVKRDTLTTAEQALAKSLAPKIPEIFGALSELAFEKKGQVRPDFVVAPQWREDLFQRITKAGVKVDRALWDAGGTWIDGEIEQRVARVAFGDSAARRRDIKDDPQLRRAVDLLKRSPTQRDLFALAATYPPTQAVAVRGGRAAADSAARDTSRVRQQATVPQASVPQRP
jgi:carboxyl-terminal processing protease